MTEVASNCDTSVNAFIEQIVALLQQEKWEEAIRCIRHDTSTCLSLPGSFVRLGGIVMGAACYKDTVPLELYQVVVQITGSDSVLYQDAGLRTPLHMVVMYLDRDDIVRFLCETEARTLEMHDQSGLRPIDILTQKILMKEERMRYLKKSNLFNEQDTPDQDVEQQRQQQIATETLLLERCWECARILCVTHGGELQRNPSLPLLHACCLAHRRIPLSLMQRTLATNRSQLKLADDLEGNTPLHVVASTTVLSNDQEEEDDEENDLLEDLCKKCPSSASKMNHNRQYPLDLAIEKGKRWCQCACLVRAYPPALLRSIRFKSGASAGATEKCFLRQFLIHKRNEDQMNNIVFQILRAAPEIVLDG